MSVQVQTKEVYTHTHTHTRVCSNVRTHHTLLLGSQKVVHAIWTSWQSTGTYHHLIHLRTYCMWARYLIRYNDWLRARRSGIESRWWRNFQPFPTGPGANPASCTMGTGSFLGVKCGRDVLLTTHPLLVPRSWKSRAIPLPTLWATPGL